MTLYDDLGLSSDASADDIKAAHRKAVKRHHPDNQDTGDADRFRAVQKAYDVLSDPEARARYDATRETSDPSNAIEAQARDRFAQLIMEAVNSASESDFHRDFFASCLAVITGEKGQVERARRKIEERRAFAIKFRERVSAKDGKANLAGTLIDHQIKGFDASLAAAKQQDAVLDRVTEIISDHQFRADERASRPTSTAYVDRSVLQDAINAAMNDANRSAYDWGPRNSFFKY